MTRAAKRDEVLLGRRPSPLAVSHVKSNGPGRPWRQAATRSLPRPGPARSPRRYWGSQHPGGRHLPARQPLLGFRVDRDRDVPRHGRGLDRILLLAAQPPSLVNKPGRRTGTSTRAIPAARPDKARPSGACVDPYSASTRTRPWAAGRLSAPEANGRSRASYPASSQILALRRLAGRGRQRLRLHEQRRLFLPEGNGARGRSPQRRAGRTALLDRRSVLFSDGWRALQGSPKAICQIGEQGARPGPSTPAVAVARAHTCSPQEATIR